MILQQYYLGCLAHASYLVADERSGVAAVVDAQRDVEQYPRDARRLGVRIGHVFLTHLHADFLAGHLELREREGATINLGGRATAEYEFAPAGDGDVVVLGPAVRLEVLVTPGHSRANHDGAEDCDREGAQGPAASQTATGDPARATRHRRTTPRRRPRPLASPGRPPPVRRGRGGDRRARAARARQARRRETLVYAVRLRAVPDRSPAPALRNEGRASVPATPRGCRD